jgi:hypothetical protein
MMKSTLLMSSMAVAALTTPAFAGPDRFDQGYSCMAGTECVQHQMRLEDGNRASERPGGDIESTGTAGGSITAARAVHSDSDDFGDEVGDEANDLTSEAGEGFSNAADEAGDEISEAADEAGDAISDAFD